MYYPKVNNTAELELLPNNTIVGMFVDDPDPILPRYYAVQKIADRWMGAGIDESDAMHSHEFEVGFPALVLYREDSDAS